MGPFIHRHHNKTVIQFDNYIILMMILMDRRISSEKKTTLMIPKFKKKEYMQTNVNIGIRISVCYGLDLQITK